MQSGEGEIAADCNKSSDNRYHYSCDVDCFKQCSLKQSCLAFTSATNALEINF